LRLTFTLFNDKTKYNRLPSGVTSDLVIETVELIANKRLASIDASTLTFDAQTLQVHATLLEQPAFCVLGTQCRFVDATTAPVVEQRATLAGAAPLIVELDDELPAGVDVEQTRQIIELTTQLCVTPVPGEPRRFACRNAADRATLLAAGGVHLAGVWCAFVDATDNVDADVHVDAFDTNARSESIRFNDNNDDVDVDDCESSSIELYVVHDAENCFIPNRKVDGSRLYDLVVAAVLRQLDNTLSVKQ
jgi:hypothetical protein